MHLTNDLPRFDSFPHIYPHFANFLKHANNARRCVLVLRAGGEVMKSHEYRSKAVECLESAPWVGDTGAKNALNKMALYWLRLADLHEASQDRLGTAGQVEIDADRARLSP